MRLVLTASLLILFSAPVPASVRPLSWVHHQKKAVPVSQTRVEYHGSTAYSAEGRLYFPTPNHAVPAPPAPTRLKARAPHAATR
jgi:hypothetical protein